MKNILVVCLLIGLAFGNERLEEKSTKNSGTKVGIGWEFSGNSGGTTSGDNLWALASNSGNQWSAVSWVYNWNSFLDAETSPEQQQIGIEYVPMMWGTRSGDITNYNNHKPFSGASAILAFNEPDNVGQSNLSPAQAVTAWKQYIQPLGLRKGAPAVTSGSTGIPWLQNFISQCSGCTIDFIPIHWYGSDPNAFIAYVQQVHSLFGKNIWVTEVACVNYDGQSTCGDQNYVYSFMGQITMFLYQAAYVERYAYFGAVKDLGGVPTTNRLVTVDGNNNTPLGVQFAQKGGCCPCYNSNTC